MNKEAPVTLTQHQMDRIRLSAWGIKAVSRTIRERQLLADTTEGVEALPPLILEGLCAAMEVLSEEISIIAERFPEPDIF